MTFKQKLHRPLVALAALACLLMFLSNIPLAHAASQLPHTPAIANWYTTFQEPGQPFFDSNDYVWLYASGNLNINVQYVYNPPRLDDQQMYVDIAAGGAYGIYPNTYDQIYNHAGNFIGNYYIQGGGCLAPGYPHTVICGYNNSSVASSSNPIVIYHHWYAEDPGGFVYGGGAWTDRANIS